MIPRQFFGDYCQWSPVISFPLQSKLLKHFGRTQESLPYIISKRWEPGASAAVLAAQLEDIVAAMENARTQVFRSPCFASLGVRPD